MNIQFIDMVAISTYFVGMTALALFTRLRCADFSAFSVAQRAVPSSMVFASLCATYIGPAYSLALASQGYQYGFLFFFVFSFFSLQTIFTSYFLSPKLQAHSSAHTLSDVLSIPYGQSASWIVSIVSVVLCTGFTAIMARAGGGILSELLGIDLVYGMLLITLVGVGYTITGGLKAVILTEGVQFIIIILSVSSLLFLSSREVQGPSALADQAIALTTASATSMGGLTLAGLAVSFFFGEMLIPPYANRALASKSMESSHRGFLFAGIFSLFWFFSIVLLGIFSFEILGSSIASENALIALSNEVLPVGLKGLFVAALAAIVMSTQESVLNAGASIFTNDIYKKLFPRQAVGSELWVSRVATLIMALSALYFAYSIPSILSILLISYAIWSPVVAIPLAWYLLGLPVGKYAGVCAMVLGGLFSAYAVIFFGGSSDNGVAILIGISGNALGMLFGIVLTKFSRANNS